jgi:hypothetical protein
MPAHIPRRVFAAPFVITVAACATPDTTLPPQEPVTLPPTADPVATSDPTVAPPNDPPTDPPTGAAMWSINRNGNSCTAMMQTTCPPDASCNPPPPSAYTCPPEVSRYPATVRRAAGSAECAVLVMPDMTCPRGAYCNPPPPHDVKVPCPK